MISRNMKLFMFAALAMLMASACVMIYDSEDSDASTTTVSTSGHDYTMRTVYQGDTLIINHTYEDYFDPHGDVRLYKASGFAEVTSGFTLSVSGNKFTFKNISLPAGNYYISMAGWNADAEIDDEEYITGITSAVPAATQYTCYLYYNANGGSGAPSTQTYTGTSTSNHSFTISSTTPAKSGYTFLGWSASSSASSASYQPGSSISVSYNGSKTLYAVWQQQVTSYSVTVYKGNWDSFKWVGGSDSTKYTSSSHTYTVTSGASFDIDWYGKAAETGSGTDYTYTTTYTSSNYNMASSSYGTSLGDSVTVTSSGKYYPAVQMTSTTTYTYNFTIKYNANGGSGAPSDTAATNSSTTKSVTLSSTTPTRSGYTFLGWSTSSTASSASYSAGSSYTFNYGTTQLYAVWKSATITVSGTPDSYGVVGSAWSFKPTVSVSGCSVSISGASWLSANGSNVSGTPTTPGTYNVTLAFSKTGYTSATKTFTVTVLSALNFESSPTGGAIIYAV